MIKAISSLMIMLSFSLGANATEEEREPINKEGISRGTYELNIPYKASAKIDKVCMMNKMKSVTESLVEGDFKHIGPIEEGHEQIKKLKNNENLITYRHDFDYVTYVDMKSPSVYYVKKSGANIFNQWVVLEKDTFKSCINK